MKTIFYLTDNGLTIYDNQVRQEVSFSWQDIEEIDNYLASIPEDCSVFIVIDLIDEDIYFEWAPKVFPWEKTTIKNRRKERIHGEEIALAEVLWTSLQQVNEDGRKEELMLSATVTDSFHLKNFLQSLEDAQIIVKAIYSKPFLLETYLKNKVRPYLKLSKTGLTQPLLMVTRQSMHAFRQTFFYEGELRISRLVEIDPTFVDAQDIRNALIDETKLAITYVYSQNIVPFDSPVGLLFLDGEASVLEGMLENCKLRGLIASAWNPDEYFFGTALFNAIIPNGAVCEGDATACFSQQAMVEFIFNDQPKGFYFTPYVQKISHLFLGKNVFIALNIALLLGGLYYALVSGVDTFLSWKKQEMLQQKIIQHESEVIKLKEMVKLQDDAQQIKSSVEFSEAILKLKVNRLIGFDISQLSQVLARHSNIQLSKIDWKTLDKFDSRRNQIELKAWVFPFHETYQQPVAWVDQFVADLKTLSGIELVSLQKEPLNRVLSQALLIDLKMGEVQALPFTVTLRVNDAVSK